MSGFTGLEGETAIVGLIGLYATPWIMLAKGKLTVPTRRGSNKAAASNPAGTAADSAPATPAGQPVPSSPPNLAAVAAPSNGAGPARPIYRRRRPGEPYRNPKLAEYARTRQHRPDGSFLPDRQAS